MSRLNTASDIKKTVLASVLLTAMVLIVYGQCGGFELVTYDDTSYVTNNAKVMEGISAENIGWAFSTFQLSNYHPMTVVSHMLDTTLFGDSPGARHLVNVFFHLANVLLLFFFLLKATAGRDEGGLIPSFFAAAFLQYIRYMWNPLPGWLNARMYCPPSSGWQPCTAGWDG